MNTTVSLLIAVSVVLVGCASDPAPDAQMRLAAQAVEQARGVGANDELPALVQAQRKLIEAEAALAEGEHKRARLLAEQAELDARLAEAQHLERRSEAQLVELNAHIDRLRQQLGGAQ